MTAFESPLAWVQPSLLFPCGGKCGEIRRTAVAGRREEQFESASHEGSTPRAHGAILPPSPLLFKEVIL